MDEAAAAASTTQATATGDEVREGVRRRQPAAALAGDVLLLALALLLADRHQGLFVQAFYIPSASMEPQFIQNDRILVQKVSYWGGGSPERGDIVVFEDPGGWLDAAQSSTPPSSPVTKVLEMFGLYPTGGHLVKRVIGVGGDRVVCCDKQGRITVNGHALDEKSYLPKGVAPSTIKFDVKVPKGHLWVMGDNRSASADSRGHMGNPGGGFVDDDLVVGKVFALIWPCEARRVHPPPGHLRRHPDDSRTSERR